MKEQQLIEILLDQMASIDEKDDAAMDLEAYDSDMVVDALLMAGKDKSIHKTVLNSVGESLGTIWLRNGSLDSESYYQLCDDAKFGVRVAMGDKFPFE